MSQGSPFETQWRECLRAHYQHVIRTEDKVTLRTLSGVLQQVGFTENELAELALTATMHIDDVPPDFMPDMTVIAAIAQIAAAPAAEEAPIPELIAAAEAAADAAETPFAPDVPADELADAPVEPDPEPAPFNPDAPTQMSLF